MINKKLIDTFFINQKKAIKNNYPLLDNAFSKEDILEGVKVLLSGKITMSNKTLEFEKNFAKFVGAKYSLMVNSGSSANLLAVFASCNPKRNNKFKRGDEAIIPSLCWSTSLWPLVQAGLKPKFVDVDPKTLNMNLQQFKRAISSKTKLVMTVHVLGNSGPIDEISKICKRKKIILIEDTCESLGALYKNKKLGTFGDFGTYSFYYSHQITSGEGGMIVCNNFADYQLIHSMRSHGWSRGIKIDAYEKKKYQHLDNKFLFINSGFNVRPLDITASIANNQLKRINKFIKIRKENREKIIGKLKSSKFWDNQFEFLKPSKNVSPSWFGLPMLISNKYLNNKKKFLKFLDKNNIENRPIISGNFLNQPCIDLYNFKYKKNNFVGSQAIEDRGFFIGLHTKKISEKELDLLENKLMKISKF